MQFLQVFRIAFRDLLHSLPSTLCLITAVAVALVPVLLLGGLSEGVVENTLSRLRSDPRILELKLVRDQEIPDQWFSTWQDDARVGFLLPRSRHLASSVRIRSEHARSIEDTRLIPSKPGDPLLAGLQPPQGLKEAALTEKMARSMGVTPGQEVEVIINRHVGNERQSQRHKLLVTAVVPRDILQTDDIFVDRDFEEAVEMWREGFGVPELGWEAAPEREGQSASRSRASFRLYAKDIRGVPGLRDDLAKEGLDVTTRAEEIEAALALEAGVGWVFTAIGIFTVLGFALTLGLHLAASAMEKARELSLLRLIGFRGFLVAAIPSLQGGMIGLLGAGGAAIAVLLAQPFVNEGLAGIGGLQGNIMKLSTELIAGAVATALLAGVASGSFAGWRITRISIADGLRHD